MSKDELTSLHSQLCQEYDLFKNQHLQLNMARGKPDYNQINLS